MHSFVAKTGTMIYIYERACVIDDAAQSAYIAYSDLSMHNLYTSDAKLREDVQSSIVYQYLASSWRKSLLDLGTMSVLGLLSCLGSTKSYPDAVLSKKKFGTTSKPNSKGL